VLDTCSFFPPPQLFAQERLKPQLVSILRPCSAALLFSMIPPPCPPCAPCLLGPPESGDIFRIVFFPPLLQHFFPPLRTNATHVKVLFCQISSISHFSCVLRPMPTVLEKSPKPPPLFRLLFQTSLPWVFFMDSLCRYTIPPPPPPTSLFFFGVGFHPVVSPFS